MGKYYCSKCKLFDDDVSVELSRLLSFSYMVINSNLDFFPIAFQISGGFRHVDRVFN